MSLGVGVKSLKQAEKNDATTTLILHDSIIQVDVVWFAPHSVWKSGQKEPDLYLSCQTRPFSCHTEGPVCHLADTERAFVSISPDCSSLFCILSLLTALINVISAAEIGLLPASLQGSHNGYLVYAYTSRPIGQSSYVWLDGWHTMFLSLALSVNIQQANREIF